MACGSARTGVHQAGASAAAPSAALRPACDPGNGGISLPQGFCAVVVADVSRPRHLAVAPNGDLYVAFLGQATAATPAERGGVVALRDSNRDGKADLRAYFGPEGGTGMAVRGDYVYFGTNTAVLRYRRGAALEPVAGPDTIVQGLPGPPGHVAKSIALGSDGSLFVNIGSPGNACQPLEQERQGGVRGQDPCPQLETRGGVWRFDANRLRQSLGDGERWATGVRNAVALDVNPSDNTPYAVSHGREALNLWTGFTDQDNATRTAEELQRLTRGSDFGWPYCFYDTPLRRRVLAPEYGGDGQEVGRCAGKQDPLVAFPGHWAPNDLLFYTGSQFPGRFRDGAFHGSWNRAPLPQAGYRVAFVPFQGGQPSQSYETFADGFAGAEPQPNQAPHRPMGLAQGPDGSLYISDSAGGRIWRVMYVGN